MIWRMKIGILLVVEEMLIDVYKHYVNKMKEINDQCKVCMEKHEDDKFDRLHIKFNKTNNKADKWRTRLNDLNNYMNKEISVK